MSELDKELSRMVVGERIAADDIEVLRVPNGWIFYRNILDVSGQVLEIDGTFVPDIRSATGQRKGKPIIVPVNP